MYVPFPGFERIFQSVLALNSTWQVNVDRELAAATASGADRFERTLDLTRRQSDGSVEPRTST